MDGFEPNEGVIVMAATNMQENLDAALMRPGRFDRHVAVPLPDVRGRLEILNYYLQVRSGRLLQGPASPLLPAAPVHTGCSHTANLVSVNTTFVMSEDMQCTQKSYAKSANLTQC